MPTFVDVTCMRLRLGFTLRLTLLAALPLAGCATYHALPLATDTGTSMADIRVNADDLPTVALAEHRFDPADGLDVTEVAMLAVANNPALRVARDQLGVTRAQAFAAGLLPDPQVTASADFVTGDSGGPGATQPFNLGLSWDVGQLLLRSSKMGAARWQSRQIDLRLLWDEWQTVARARTLFDAVLHDRAVVERLGREVHALDAVGSQLDQALQQGAITFDVASTGLNAEADARRQQFDARRRLDGDEHALRGLLGLPASAPLNLVGPAYVASPDQADIEAALKDLPRCRPDLLALEDGYAAQNESLRAAILAQYPDITVGFTRARDSSAVYTSGISIGLNLPLFNRNRGNIAIERATRQQLRDEFTARLLATRNEVSRLRADLQDARRAAPLATAHAAKLDAALSGAMTAWKSGSLDWTTYLAIRSSALSADLQALAIKQQMADTAVALQTLLGGDWSVSAHKRLEIDQPPSASSGETS